MFLRSIIDEVHEMSTRQSQRRGAEKEQGGFKSRQLLVDEAIRARVAAEKHNISEKVGGPKELRRGKKGNMQF